MAYALHLYGDAEKLDRENFIVIYSELTGRHTLLIPAIAVEMSCEGYCDILARCILRDIETAEETDA